MEEQLAHMALLGLRPDRVLIQSEAQPRHAALFELARRSGVVYPCTCSRKEIQAEFQLVEAKLLEAELRLDALRRLKSRSQPDPDEMGWRLIGRRLSERTGLGRQPQRHSRHFRTELEKPRCQPGALEPRLAGHKHTTTAVVPVEGGHDDGGRAGKPKGGDTAGS